MQQVEMGVKIVHFKQFHSPLFLLQFEAQIFMVFKFMSLQSHDTFTVLHQSPSFSPMLLCLIYNSSKYESVSWKVP